MRFRYSTEKNGRPVRKAAVYTQDEHKINFADVDSQAVYVTERLQANGYETYIVGGAVRDLILGKKPKDFDIVTAANPTRIKKVFRNARIIGRRFRLVHVFFGPKIFEVSTFRSIKDGPTSNTFGTIEEDVLRRDFTLNALFYDPMKQIVVDYVGGMKDIRKHLIRPIIALPDIFTDDPVRMIRAVKYGAVTGFRLPLTLKWRIRRQSGLLAGISPSRLTEEIFKIIHSPHAREIVEGLDTLGLYQYLQPGAVEIFNTKPAFRTRYLDTLGTLKREGFINLPGETMSVLIRDYLEDVADWDGNAPPRGGPQGESAEHPGTETGSAANSGPRSPAERYRNAFALARKFVLPMNPPRKELDDALRLLFMEHGVLIKKTRFNERRPQIPEPGGKPVSTDKPAEKTRGGEKSKDREMKAVATAPEKERSPSAAEKVQGDTPHKRRRRRKKSPASGKENINQ